MTRFMYKLIPSLSIPDFFINAEGLSVSELSADKKVNEINKIPAEHK